MHARVLFLIAAVLTGSSTARADLPPPDGIKNVEYTFRVTNLGAFPEWVMIAYPASDTNGKPVYEHAVVPEDTPVRIGRRNPGSPRLYLVKKDAFATWQSTFKPKDTMDPDPDVEKLIASEGVVRCDRAPSPIHSLKSDDMRDSIREKFRLVAVDAGSCRLEAPAPPTREPYVTPPKSGCAGCATGQGNERGVALAILATLALAHYRRHQRYGSKM
jgi:hypothetical protein